MNELDKKIEQQLNIIEHKKTELEKDQELIDTNWKTSGRIVTLNGEDKRLKVMGRDDVIALCSEFIVRKEAFDKTKKLLCIEDEFNVDSFSYDDWIFDIKKRLATITKKSKLQELEKLETRLKNIMSEDLKRSREFEDILNSIK